MKKPRPLQWNIDTSQEWTDIIRPNGEHLVNNDMHLEDLRNAVEWLKQRALCAWTDCENYDRVADEECFRQAHWIVVDMAQINQAFMCILDKQEEEAKK